MYSFSQVGQDPMRARLSAVLGMPMIDTSISAEEDEFGPQRLGISKRSVKRLRRGHHTRVSPHREIQENIGTALQDLPRPQRSLFILSDLGSTPARDSAKSAPPPPTPPTKSEGSSEAWDTTGGKRKPVLGTWRRAQISVCAANRLRKRLREPPVALNGSGSLDLMGNNFADELGQILFGH